MLKKNTINISIVTEIQDQNGEIVALINAPIQFSAEKKNTNLCEFEIKNPNFWDTENPHLYTATVQLKKGNEIIVSAKSEGLKKGECKVVLH